MKVESFGANIKLHSFVNREEGAKEDVSAVKRVLFCQTHTLHYLNFWTVLFLKIHRKNLKNCDELRKF